MLGPVEAWRSGVRIELGQPRQRALLAALAFDVHRPVQVETLVQRVWGESPPPSARHALHVYVAQLRSIVDPQSGRQRVVRRSGGYLLELPEEAVDLHRFDALVHRAQRPNSPDEQRIDLLQEALRLWRGDPMADIHSTWADLVRVRWQRRHVDAAVAFADAAIRVGRPDAAVDLLTELASRHPLAEPLAVALIRVLAASGRTADALAAFTAVRSRLVDEIGADPGPQLRQAHLDVLRAAADSPTPPPPAARPVALVPAALPGFVGRRAELDHLDTVLADAASEPAATAVAVLTGPPGVGKTALAVRWAHQVTNRFPDGQLYANLRGFDPVGAPAEPAEVARRFLIACGTPPDGMPIGTDELLDLYRSTLSGRRILVVLDNARDVRQVRPLLPASRHAVVVVTSRNPLSGLLAGGARAVPVRLFDQSDSRELLRRRLGTDRLRDEPDAVDEVIARCARLPLALAVVAARCAMRPETSMRVFAEELRDSTLDALADPDESTDVQGVFSCSYRMLTSAAARLFRLIGIAPGPDLSLAAVASLAGCAVTEARELLAELDRTSLVAEPQAGRFASHDLLRAYARALADAHEPPERRHRALRRLFDFYLQGAMEASDVFTRRERVPIDAPLPGVVRLGPLDQPTAVGWLTAEHRGILTAIETSAHSGHRDYCWRLAWAIALHQQRQGLWQEQATAQHTALDAATAIGDALGSAHAHRLLGLANVRLGDSGEARAHYEQALPLFIAAGDTLGQALTHIGLSYLMQRDGDTSGAIAQAEESLTLLRAKGGTGASRATEASVLNNLGWLHSQAGDHRRALPYCEQALLLHLTEGHLPGQAAAADTLAAVHEQIGQYEQAIAGYGQAIEAYAACGDRYNQADSLVHLGDAYRRIRSSTEAKDAWRKALALFTELEHPDGQRVRDRLASS